MEKCYQILKLTKKGHLVMWDGPCHTKSAAKLMLAQRRKARPNSQFFIYKVDKYYTNQ